MFVILGISCIFIIEELLNINGVVLDFLEFGG